MVIDLRMTRLIVTAHDGAVVGDVSPREILGLERTDEINGEHTLTIRTTQQLYKNDRVLLRDGTLRWYEYVIQSADTARVEGGLIVHTYHCVWSLQHDLSETYIDTQVGLRPGKTSVPHPVRDGLEAALGGTERWGIGTITVTTMASGSFYRRSGWEGLSTVVEKWGGEVDAEIEVGLNGVTSRKVALLAHVGSATAVRRFDYGHDLTTIKRTLVDEPWTARIVPLGKSKETEAGGYTRRPTIAGVNDGVVWIEDPDAVASTRIPNGSGGWEHPVQIVLNDTYEEPADLLTWAQAHIKDYTQPRVKYDATVMQFEEAGLSALGVSLGDEVAIVDREFKAADMPDGMRLDGRVVKIKADLLDPTNTVLTLGTLSYSVARRLHGLSGRIDAVESQILGMSVVQSTAEYLSYLIGALNGEINATGGYTYITEGEGLRTYDVAVSDPLVGAEAHRVVEIKGGSIRIADSRTSGGDWDWKTLIVSGHVASELVTAAQITSGYIGSAGSGNYWDLDTGEFRMASTATLGGRTVQAILDGIDATITDVDVQFAENQSTTVAPTTGWATTAPAWREGWYIWQRTATTTEDGTTYSDPVCISGKDGADGTSVTILGSYETLADLQAAHPTGSEGDAYMVGSDLYVWTGSAWEDVGQIQGPAGPQGPPGTSVGVSKIEYGTSASASTAPASGSWSQTPPTSITKGRWLWVRTTYTNGSVAITKSYVGTDGADGKYVAIKSTTKVDGVTTVVLEEVNPETGATSERTLTIDDGTDGPSGTPGANGYVHVAWANSADGATDFSTTVSEGKSYLGVYTDNTAADSTNPSAYSWSKIEGERGRNGTSVTVTSIEYAISESSSVPPAAADWSTVAPETLPENTWLWVRTTYSDGSAATAKSYVGKDGKDGKSVYVQSSSKVDGVTTVKLSDGTNVTTLTIRDGSDGPQGTPGATGYIHVAWANSQDGYTDFSTTVSEGKSYLGVYTDDEADDSTDPTMYSWTKIEGDRGATGRGVSAVTEQFYLSTSSTTQTGGSWSTAQPKWEKDKYIWTRTVVTWTDGTATITDPIIAEAFNGVYESLDELSISATNLVRNGDFTNTLSYWTAVGTTYSVATDTSFESYMRAVQGGAGGSGYRVYANLADSFRHEVGKTYSISFWAKANASNTLWCLQGVSKAEATSYVAGKAIGTGWQRYTGTIIATTDGGLNFFLENAGTLSLAKVMLVEGDKPMLDWSPDPRDALVPVDKYLTQTEVFKRLTNNGAIQGLYMSGGNLYINASYIKTGSMSADLIKSGKLESANGKVYFDLTNSTLVCDLMVSTEAGNSNVIRIGKSTLGGTDSTGFEVSGAQFYQEGNSAKGLSIMVGDWTSAYNDGSPTIMSAGYGMRMLSRTQQGGGSRDHGFAGVMVSNGGCAALIGQHSGDAALVSSLNVTTPGSLELGTVMCRPRWMGSGTTYTQDGRIFLSGHVHAQLTIHAGALEVSGSKSRTVETQDYGTRKLHAYETPAPYFGDIGSATIGEDGLCYVDIDPIFAETARTDMAYQVFLQKCGEGDLWVTEKAPTHFVVRGTAGLAFDWEAKAHQRGYETNRLDDKELSDISEGELGLGEVPSLAYDDELDYVSQLERLYEEA